MKSEANPFPRTVQEMMGWSCSFRVVLVLALLALPGFSHGFSRKVIETYELGDSSVELEETAGKSRGMYELDYDLDPKPNTNPKTGYIYSPPQG
ncbi:hypothetical protein NC652_038158 [Populus alba x Populus x berolinensis]|nr:hypothetical protein NC652_038158 [Populus alba x Populus x berolinensis]KAJ6960024.1 hypothetical protein NC653_038163 [Populus alba x Populus x berolinensis]